MFLSVAEPHASCLTLAVIPVFRLVTVEDFDMLDCSIVELRVDRGVVVGCFGPVRAHTNTFRFRAKGTTGGSLKSF